MWQTAEDVARAALDGLARNRRVVIPGRAVRASVAGNRFVPRVAQLRVLDRFYRASAEV